jgi:hypothetical protein
MTFSKRCTLLIFFHFSHIYAVQPATSPHAITYELSGADYRLGNNIYTYSATKWLAYKYNLQFYFFPFGYSNYFVMSEKEPMLTRRLKNTYRKIIGIKSESELCKHLREARMPTLFVTQFPLYCHVPTTLKKFKCFERNDRRELIYFFMRQTDKFGKDLTENLMIKPRYQSFLPTPHFPTKQIITVAVHIRKGSFLDTPTESLQYFDEDKRSLHDNKSGKAAKADSPYNKAIDKLFPLTFPPEQFFLDQIKNLSALLNNPPLFVYIFTDDKHPDHIVKRLERRITQKNIFFACAEGAFPYQKNVIADLYAMSLFDCLIKPGSFYSWISQMLGKHNIIIFPQSTTWINNNMLTINDVGIILYDRNTRQTEYFSFNKITEELKRKALSLFKIRPIPFGSKQGML